MPPKYIVHLTPQGSSQILETRRYANLGDVYVVYASALSAEAAAKITAMLNAAEEAAK